MRNEVWTGMCAAVLFSATVAIAAQQPPATPPTPPSTPPAAAPATPTPTQPLAQSPAESANKITVTGCLQPASPTPTGTAGTTDANRDSASSEKFVLTNVTTKDSGAASAPGARTYQLVANETALTPHAGKKLEVTGILDDQAGATRGATAETPGSAAKPPKLIAESAKIVAPTCAE